MKSDSAIARRVLLLGGILLSGLAIVGCGLNGVSTHKWTEDVRLADGSTVTVKRTIKLQRADALGGGALSMRELDARIDFQGALGALPTWRFPRMALLLYRDTGTDEWVIVASSGMSDEIAKNKNNPPYWEFRVSEGQWAEVPLSRASIGRSANLYFSYGRLDKDHITVTDTQELVANPIVHGPFRKIEQ